MQHHYLTREAILTWLAIERGEGISSEELLTHAFTTEFFDESEETLAARIELEALSLEELRSEYLQRIDYHTARLASARDDVEAGLFFNKPGAFADYGFWSRQLIWSIEECIALSLGRDPDFVSSWSLLEGDLEVQSSRLAREFIGRLRIARNWIRAGQLQEESTPGEFLAWLQRAQLSYPPEMYQAVLDIGVQIADWKTLYDASEADLRAAELANDELNRQLREAGEYALGLCEQHAAEVSELVRNGQTLTGENRALYLLLKDRPKVLGPEQEGQLDPRLKTTLYCLINLMASEKYQYRATDGKSPSPANLAKALADKGIIISEKTILKHLRASSEIVEAERKKALMKQK